MSIISENYLREAERKIKRFIKRNAAPELPGKFYAVWWKPETEETEPHDRPPQFRRSVVYAHSEIEALNVVRERNPRAEVRQHTKGIPYKLALSELTVRSGSLIALLNADCLERLLADFERWQATRERIEIEPPRIVFHQQLQHEVEAKTSSTE